MASTRTIVCLIGATLLVSACRTPTPIRSALPQDTRTKANVALKIAGVWDADNNTLTLTANGEPALRGSFPPYTPTLNMNGDFRGTPMRAECYFSSILSSRRGLVGIVGGAVQSGTGKTADTCKVFVEDREPVTLNF